MDFDGMVGLDCLVGESSEDGGGGRGNGAFSSPLISDHRRQKGISGYGYLRHERSGAAGLEENQWRCLKVARSEPMMTEATKATPFLLGSNSNSLFIDGEQMLSFSSSALPYARNTGLGSGYPNANMHEALTGVRGAFTPSQWMELEHQALIYKYIEAKVTIPSSLLTPLRKNISTSGLAALSAGSFRSINLGWGNFQLGLSGNVDPEPGRCRRTDGKKWRCSRDAVVDQKYCERHMNRGRHRSRKHVEGNTCQAAKPMLAVAPSEPASAFSDGKSSNSLTVARQQMKSLQQNALDPSPSWYNRTLMNKDNANDSLRDPRFLSKPTNTNPEHMNTLFPVPRQNNPLEVNSSISDFAWLDSNQIQTDRTQLSISIPMDSLDFSSPSYSPNQEKVTLSPLRLSREFNPIHMGLGLGNITNEASQQQASWIPISWEASVGGPLGEALANTSSTPKDHPPSCLNLLTDGWDSSPRLRSSPTDVLQMATFGSLSSSAGSSPRPDNHSIRGDLLGSTFVNSSTVLW